MKNSNIPHFKLRIWVIVFYMVFGCASNTNPMSDLKKMKLKGKVVNIIESEYWAIYKYGEILKGDLKHKNQYIFNKYGNIIEDRSLSSDNRTVFGKTVYTYNDNNNLIEKKDVNSGGFTIYSYDNKGNLIEEYSVGYNIYLMNKRIEYKYDIHDNNVEYSIFDDEGKLKTRHSNEFNKHGQIIKTTVYDANGEYFMVYSYNNKYNNDGSIIEENLKVSEPEEGTPNMKTHVSKTYYKYDEHGNILSEGYNGNDKPMISYEYEYDKKGNWVKRTYFHFGVLSDITEREIQY